MNEINSNQLNTNGTVTSTDPGEEHSPLALFILQRSVNDALQEKTPYYQLKTPLCVSQRYEEEFFNYFHMNYFGELEREGLFIASVRPIRIKSYEIRGQLSSFDPVTNDDENEYLVKAIIRTQENNYDVSGIINIKNEDNILQFLLDKTKLSPICHVELIHDITANEKILEFDKYNDEQLSMEVGIVYQNLNQSKEIDILSNNEMSTEMEMFLNLISELVQLKNFNKYRGDLDTKTDQHGIYSYFTTYQNHQIMFNVAPMILSDKNDLEFIQRKSLISNALICIIFQQENNLSFQPNFFLGKVTQVYIIVQPIHNQFNLYYKIEIWRRTDIEPIVNPSVGIFKHDKSFRDYFLTLILNTMNTILKKDFFQKRIIEQRYRLKNEYLMKLFQRFNSYSKHEFSTLYNNDNNIPIENSNIREQITLKHFQVPKITKMMEKLNVHHRSKQPLRYTASAENINQTDIVTSPTITKQNPWTSVNQKLRRLSSATLNVKHSHSPTRAESPSSLFKYVNSQQEEEPSMETILSLAKNRKHSIGPSLKM
ncbi:unnamed protein product [Rotaria sordida]|uniref:Rap-GAP domain-containing protein n=1 Tax=Rotaria sordida TaxID=392033 RepID=A0A815SPI9_9BILA|nr:unnamed protein product [Rotaria sordida]CAF4050735.1 unnamed protein product [Rotaria sordida]